MSSGNNNLFDALNSKKAKGLAPGAKAAAATKLTGNPNDGTAVEPSAKQKAKHDANAEANAVKAEHKTHDRGAARHTITGAGSGKPPKGLDETDPAQAIKEETEAAELANEDGTVEVADGIDAPKKKKKEASPPKRSLKDFNEEQKAMAREAKEKRKGGISSGKSAELKPVDLRAPLGDDAEEEYFGREEKRSKQLKDRNAAALHDGFRTGAAQYGVRQSNRPDSAAPREGGRGEGRGRGGRGEGRGGRGRGRRDRDEAAAPAAEGADGAAAPAAEGAREGGLRRGRGPRPPRVEGEEGAAPAGERRGRGEGRGRGPRPDTAESHREGGRGGRGGEEGGRGPRPPRGEGGRGPRPPRAEGDRTESRGGRGRGDGERREGGRGEGRGRGGRGEGRGGRGRSEGRGGGRGDFPPLTQ